MNAQCTICNCSSCSSRLRLPIGMHTSVIYMVTVTWNIKYTVQNGTHTINLPLFFFFLYPLLFSLTILFSYVYMYNIQYTCSRIQNSSIFHSNSHLFHLFQFHFMFKDWNTNTKPHMYFSRFTFPFPFFSHEMFTVVFFLRVCPSQIQIWLYKYVL